MAKEPGPLKWIEDFLPDGFIRKPMFGGFGYYLDGLIVLLVFESHGDRVFKKNTYTFDLWNGCLFPCERENHPAVKKLYPILINHPIISKWLYLPAETEDFDNHVEDILRMIRRKSKLFGVTPKKKGEKKGKKSASKSSPRITNTRTPQMFRDEPIEVKLASATKISDLKNLGPSSEAAFAKAGIKSIKQFVNLGWKKSLIKLVASNPKNRHSIFAYALIGALSNTAWNAIPESEKLTARKFVQSLKLQKTEKSKK